MYSHHFSFDGTLFTPKRLIFHNFPEGEPTSAPADGGDQQSKREERYEAARSETRKMLEDLRNGENLDFKIGDGEVVQSLTKEDLKTQPWARSLFKEAAPEQLQKIGILNEAHLSQLYHLYRRPVFNIQLEQVIVRTLVGSLKRELAGKRTKKEKAEVVMKYGDFQDVNRGLFGKQITNPEKLVEFWEKDYGNFDDNKKITTWVLGACLGREPEYIGRIWDEI